MTRLLCRLLRHRWVDAGWHAKTCTRCGGHVMWWES